MHKVTLTFEFGSVAEADAFLANVQEGLGAPLEGEVIQPARTAPAAPAAPAGAAPRPPGPPAGGGAPRAPAAAPAAPAAPPPPPPAAAVGATAPAVMAAMSEFAKVHKPAGCKAVLAMCLKADNTPVTKVTEATPDQLEWLLATFQSGQMPA